MALDFLKGVEDKRGGAVYIIHDGTPPQFRELKEFGLTVLDKTERQVLLIDAKQDGGRELVAFYSVPALPAILVVRDDDQVYQMWYGTSLPDAAMVAYTVDQIG